MKPNINPTKYVRPKSDEITTFLWNVQGLSNKLYTVEEYVHSLDVDVICLIEHWLSPGEIELFNLKGYNLGNSYCRPVRKHGGCVIFVKDTISNKPIDKINSMSTEMVFEVAASFLSDINTIVVAVYRPNVECKDFNLFIDNMNMLLESLCTFNANIILCGDFNVDFNLENKLETILLNNLFYSFNLRSIISGITRPKFGGDDGSCLDKIFTITNRSIEGSVVKTIVSDHWAVLLKSLVDGTKTLSDVNKGKQVMLIKEENIFDFVQNLSQIDWTHMYKSLVSLDEKVKFFMTELVVLSKKAFPLKCVTNKLTKPRPTKVRNKDIDRLKAKCELYYDYYLSTGSDKIKTLYKKSKKNLQKLVRETRIKNYDNIIDNSTNKSKAMWNIVRKESGTKHNAINCINQISPYDFNTFFIDKIDEILDKVSKVPHTNNSSFYLNKLTKPALTFTFQLVEIIDIEKIINKMSNSRCVDIYNLNSLVLKYGANELKEALTHLINSCIIDCVFPKDFKFVKVIPIFKKGKRSIVDNYRPISIIPVVSKVLETVLNNQIVKYFENNNLFSNSQYGYRSGLGTVKAAISFVKECICRLDSKKTVNIKLYDLSKAFDTVSHTLLLEKLRFYGFQDGAVSLMQSYLSGRFQKVVLDGQESSFLPVSHGVPQGSILGPILFIIYINDLTNNITSPLTQSYLFADDLSICFNADSKEALDVIISSTSQIVKDWCSANLLCLNIDKVQELVLSFDHNVQKNNSVSFLGFTIDQNLKWADHIRKLESKLCRGIYLLRRLRLCVSLRVLKIVYFAQIHSHLSYGAILWGHQSSCARLFILQKLCIRLICGLPSRAHCRLSFIELGIMTVPALFIYQCLLYIKENFNLYEALGSSHNYSTRNRDSLGLFRCNYRGTQKSFYYVSLKFYNALPLYIKLLPFLKFKKTINKLLTNNCIYDVDEYFEIDFNHMNPNN